MMMKEQNGGGKGGKLSAAEEMVLRMMLERVKLGKRLKPSVLKLRRAYFTVRNMLRVQYRNVNNFGQTDNVGA